MISTHNGKLYYKHTERRLKSDKEHVFICGYENDTVSIIEKLQKHASAGIAGYSQAGEHWVGQTSRGSDDSAK